MNLCSSFVKPRDWEKWASCRSPLFVPQLESAGRFIAIDHVMSRNLLSSPVWATPEMSIQPSASTRIGSAYSPPSSPLTDLGSDGDDDRGDHVYPALSGESLKHDIVVINTRFDPSIKSNKVAPISSRDTDQAIFAATENLRKLASQYAVTPEDMADLKDKVSIVSMSCVFSILLKDVKLEQQLHTGARTSPKQFIRITSALLQGYSLLSSFFRCEQVDHLLPYRKPLRINDVKGRMLVIIDPTLPDNIRHALVDRMFLVFDKDFKPVDTEAEGFDNMFPSMHYSHYNRYSVQVSH